MAELNVNDAAKLICEQIFPGENVWDNPDVRFEPFKDRCRATARKIIALQCANCGLSRSMDEALNTGDGVYRP